MKVLFILKKLFAVLCLLLLCLSCSKEKPVKLYIFAAASTTDTVNELIEVYKKTENPNALFAASYASSGALAKQIVDGGADADIFISASAEWLKYLKDHNKLEPGSEFIFGKNSLVIVASQKAKGMINKPEDLIGALSVSKLAMGDPKHVPAGRYGEEALSYYNMFDMLKKSRKLAFYSDVRKTLNSVELLQADYGIVYKTDAVKSQKVKIAYTFTSESHQPIDYPACAVAGKKNPERDGFIKFMRSKIGAEIIAKHGF